MTSLLLLATGTFRGLYKGVGEGEKDENRAHSNLVLEQEQATEEAVEVCCQQRQIHSRGAGSLDHHRHEAIQPEHAPAESDVQQT